MNRRVYLAGPIRFTSYGEATGWRQEVAAILKACGVEPLSPMRGKEYLSKEKRINGPFANGSYPHLLSTPAAINGRDRFDVMSSDVVLMNLLGAERVSIGTMIEVGWADAYRKPILLVDSNGSCHDHAMVRQAASWITDDLYEAVVHLLDILNVEAHYDDPAVKMAVAPRLVDLCVRYSKQNAGAAANGSVSR